MRIIDEKLLNRSYRISTVCMLCGRKGQCEPEHWICRGQGNGRRLDIDINLLAIGRTCHTKVHAGEISKHKVLTTISEREGIAPDQIFADVWHILRLPKETTRTKLQELGLAHYVSPTAAIPA
jgi:hypothetical protein